MSVYYLTEFRKTDKSGKEHSCRVCFTSCFGEILDDLDCIEIRSAEHDDYTSEIKTYRFDDIENVYLPKMKKLKKKAKKELAELKKRLSTVSSSEVYEKINENIGYAEDLIKSYKNDIKYAEYVVDGVNFFFSDIEDLYETSGILMETEIG